MPIPRKLFQTSQSYNALPPEIISNIAHLQALNPDWEYQFFDDERMRSYLRKHLMAEDWRLLQEVNPKYGVVFADIFRYVVIYNEGGVYLDIKSTATRPFSEAISPDAAFVISQWPNKIDQKYKGYGLHPELADVPGGEFQQWNIIAEPMHPFLKAVIAQVFQNIRNYTPSQFGTDAYAVLRVSGPIAFTKAIYPLLDHYSHIVVDVESRGLVYSIYDSGSATAQSHQIRIPGHYSAVREPVVIRDLYVAPQRPAIVKLGELLSAELRDNTDLVLKLAVFSFVATMSALIFFLSIIIFLLVRW